MIKTYGRVHSLLHSSYLYYIYQLSKNISYNCLYIFHYKNKFSNIFIDFLLNFKSFQFYAVGKTKKKILLPTETISKVVYATKTQSSLFWYSNEKWEKYNLRSSFCTTFDWRNSFLQNQIWISEISLSKNVGCWYILNI